MAITKTHKGYRMKKGHRNFKLVMPSLTEDKRIIQGTSQSISLHEVENQYLILSINNFNRCNNVGFFNRKTDFRIGEENSIIVLDHNLEQLHIKTSEIESTPNKPQYLVYPIPAFYLEKNDYFLYDNFKSGKTEEIQLSFEFGEHLIKLVQALANDPKNKDILISKNTYGYGKDLYNLLISYNSYGYSINKNLLLNSNTNFLLGILNGLETNVFSNINIYTFTTILNYLGAMYSITRGVNDSRVLSFRLPEVFRSDLLTNELIDFKNDTKHLEYIVSKIEDPKSNVFASNLWEHVISGHTELIKANDLQFIKVDQDKKTDMYDFTMQRADATNYTIPFGPLLKNSDGDILGVIGIFGQESLEEAKEFSPETKDYFKSFNDGEIQSWITKDAVLGLYNITKTL